MNKYKIKIYKINKYNNIIYQCNNKSNNTNNNIKKNQGCGIKYNHKQIKKNKISQIFNNNMKH